jgi:Zn-dependent metalloprotease
MSCTDSRPGNLHPCGYTPCFIAPPDLLARLAEEGTPEQREAAIRTLAASASMRARRSLAASLMGTLDADVHALAFGPHTSGERVTVYDVHNGGRTDLPGDLVMSHGDADTGDKGANQAYHGADTTYRFYQEVYGRESVDGKGLELVSSVHYGNRYENAFWDGGQMVYGDGGGGLFLAGGLTSAIDVIGHELTHGVTQYTANLVYSKQPGALNESMSDVFGSLVKQYSLGQTADQADWLIGADILEPALGKALRSMSAPGTAFDGDNQPATMADYKDLPDDNDPRNDNGGVHINSGIPNHAFYLAATAIGGKAWEKAGKIWYTALTDKLDSTSDFEAAANATVEVAGAAFSGGSEQEAVHSAWQQVGVLA